MTDLVEVIRMEDGRKIVRVLLKSVDDEIEIENLAEALKAQIEPEGIPRVVLDLRQTEFISSSFISDLTDFQRRIRNRHGRFCLCSPTDEFATALKLTGLERKFQIAGNIADAMDIVGA
ncbi:MAG: STAS domain-containing protein [Planctomycetes bacterium]|nr:STAS domain-containing protein [Planctomycetota bacterium]